MNKETIQKIEIRQNHKIMTTTSHQYFVKKKKHYQQEEIYKLLEERNFNHFLKPLEVNEREEIFPYIQEKHYRKEEKAIDMMNVLSLLQNKTTFYKEIVLDEVKEFYEKTKKEIAYLTAYYQDLEDLFFKEVFPSPAVYLFQRNLSLLFSSLLFAQETLDEWYKMISTQKEQRQVLVHHKCELSHLLEEEQPVLISLDQMSYGNPTEDLIGFIKKHCLELDLDALFRIHQQKYPLRHEEFLYLALQLSIPPKLEISSTYNGTVFLSELFQKMNCYRLFLLKHNERYQKKHQ